MFPIVLPFVVAAAGAIDVRVPVEIVIVVDVDVAAVVPIAITPVVVGPADPEGDAGPQREPHPRHVSRIGDG